MTESYSFGFAVGILVAIIICVVLFKLLNTDKKIKTQYDERQQEIRGRAYKYSFYTVIFEEAIIMILRTRGIAEFVWGSYLVQLFVMLSGLLVLCVYSILKGAYWGINNNPRRYMVVIVIATICNILPIIGSIAGGDVAKDGIGALPWVNIMVVIWMALIGVSGLVKKVMDKKSGEED